MNPQPVRIQSSRKKGAKLVSPNGLGIVCVTRPGKWGNPYKPGTVSYVPGMGRIRIKDKAHAVAMFQHSAYCVAAGAVFRATVIEELHDKNLACYCGDGEVCHADVLLKLANPDIDFKHLKGRQP